MTFYSGPNRYLCSVLDEMRKMLETLSWANTGRYKKAQAMLIEEAQTLANRMEAALEDWDDIRRAHDKIKELKKEIRELEKERE